MIHESRRTLRRQVSGRIGVLDMVAEHMIGQLSNLSEKRHACLVPYLFG